MKRKVFSFMLVFILLFTTLAYAVNISIDDANVSFTNQTGVPFVDSNSRTQVPLRITMESFGAQVSWNQDTQTAIVEKNGTKVEAPVGKSYIVKNGQQIKNDTAAIIKDSRTYLPIRAVLEAFGADVGWTGATQTVTVDSQPLYSKNLEIHFLDVGQADCILIELPNNEEILIDAGNSTDASTIINYLKNENIYDIEYFIITHPHEDHIGSAVDILNNFEVDKVYLPDVTAATQTYEDTLSAIQNNNVTAVKAKGGLDIVNIPGEIEFEVLAPNSMFYSEMNEYSVVTKLTYEDTSFIFAGDAESVSELEMIRGGYNLDCDLLKVAHHGGYTSTSQVFLNATTPTYSVISAGAGNDYGHPDQATLIRLANIGSKVYRTDEQGSIVASSNGQNITLNKAASATIASPIQIKPVITPPPVLTVTINTGMATEATANYVGNKNTFKLHYPSCSSVDDMNESNKVFFLNRQDAINQMYVPCKRCNP